MNTAEKKCPHCSNWTYWERLESDRCNNCGELLLQQEVTAKKEKENRLKSLEEEFKKKWPFTVKDHDFALVKFMKISGEAVYSFFVTVLMIFLWIVFWIVI